MNVQTVRSLTMVRVSVMGVLLCFSSSLLARSPLDGVWQTGEDNSKVEVAEQNGEVVGKLISSDNPKAKMGIEILRNFKLVDGIWTGKIYAVKRDRIMDATITPSADSLLIKVPVGFITKKVTWTRTQP